MAEGLYDEILRVTADLQIKVAERVLSSGAQFDFAHFWEDCDGSFAPWREKHGKALLGIGGMDKRAFAADYAAVDREIERLRPIVELGGYIPCPDHLIAPDAIWENVRYYCEKMRRAFG
ncbi:MAG: hypothetical protein FWE91_06260 [Defluviitaleaceae bacterium]|nr:hypothetical protein [Defluviitaleaceae bacterium]MCL2836289.1 hypothetical protein [Defluviitaleaceae bacterium]